MGYLPDCGQHHAKEARRPPVLWALFGQGHYGKDNTKKFCKISLALALAFARGIAIGFLGLLPGKSAINQALAAESSATDQGFYFPEELKAQETVWMGWLVGDNKTGKY